MTILDPHYRGDTFRYEFELGGGWTGADFTSGIKFTLRTRGPASSVVTDADAVDQATTADGSITMNGTLGVILIPASRTTSWPARELKWDLQGIVSGSPSLVYTIDSGSIEIFPDMTRAQ